VTDAVSGGTAYPVCTEVTPPRVWLICPKCQIREWLQPHTQIAGCSSCGAARHAVDDQGRPVLLWSGIQDATRW
jgi:hypothetical protein